MRVDVVQSIDDVVVGINAPDSVINLFENFDDPFTTGQVATFQLENGDSFVNGGQIELLLFDQPGAGAPIAVDRFSSLVNNGDFDDLVVNRGDLGPTGTGFVIQAGQFTLDSETSEIGLVAPGIDAIEGEASTERSNTPGTIAFALSTGPDTATTQFFFNVSNNAPLDTFFAPEGGFTSFGEVLTDADFDVVEAIVNNPVFAPFQGNAGFLPAPALVDGVGVFPGVDIDEIVRFSEITIASQDELIFTATSSNPELVVPSIESGDLTLDFADGQTGTAEITVSATNLLGDSTTDTFSVEVTEDIVVDPPDDLDLDLDGDGLTPSVDVLNIFRVLAGAPQAIVAPEGISQQAIADAVNSFSDLGLDVDGSGTVEASVDVLNIFRVLAGAPQAVVVPDGVAVSQQDVVDAVNDLLT